MVRLGRPPLAARIPKNVFISRIAKEAWASTPAAVWTAERPQELGIHAHVHDGHSRIENDTFGEVVCKGRNLTGCGWSR